MEGHHDYAPKINSKTLNKSSSKNLTAGTSKLNKVTKTEALDRARRESKKYVYGAGKVDEKREKSKTKRSDDY